MSIIEKIKNSVTSATGLPFYYDTPQTINVRLDRATFPAAMLFIVTSGAVRDMNGILRERLNAEVIFTTAGRTSAANAMDFDGLDVEKMDLDKMKVHAFTWLLSLFRSHDLRLISLNNTTRYYQTDDVMFNGYGVNITIEEIEGISSCDILSNDSE